MKPTSPEDRDLESASAQVSERYRSAAQDGPSAQLDAAVKAAARRNIAQPRQRHNWQRPVSIAAMLVLGVSLVLVVRDNEPPLPSLERPAGEEAKLARPAPAQLAMKAKPDSREQSLREDRPSRDRSVRPARESVARDELAAARDTRDNQAASGASGTSAQSAPAAPTAVGSVQPAERSSAPVADSAALSADKKASVGADVAGASAAGARSLRKQESAVSLEPRAWLVRIEGLLRAGKDAEARRQLIEFRREYPQYPLADRLRALLPPAAAQ